MPGRIEPFINGGIYHIFNKTIESKKIFADTDYCIHCLNLFKYYRSTKPLISFSAYKKASSTIRFLIEEELELEKYFHVEIFCYCLMPNHFHLLLRQKSEGGISKFISDSLNALTRFYNIQNERKGPIFLPKFKAVKITTDEQFKHTSRYIHLNPYSSGIVKLLEQLVNYSWSSLRSYIDNFQDNLVNTNFLLKMFDFNKVRYKKFVFNQADYQRNLELIKLREKK